MEWAGNPNLPLLIVSKYALNVILTKNSINETKMAKKPRTVNDEGNKR